MSDFLSMTLSENQIIVKNAEGDLDTKATILIKNKIDYIPKVSVIIPVYNTEKYLRECLDSVINQSLKEIEIICIDDGSTDNSLEILKEYAAKDNRILVVSRTNCGVGYSRNEGIQKAKGEFLAFIDPDDYYPDNNVILILYQKAILNSVLICGGSLLIYDENKKECYQKDNNKDLFKCDGIMDYSGYQFDYGFQRFIYSRKMVLKNNIFFPNYKRYQDPIFMIKAMDCAKKIYVVKSHTYTYRMEHKTVTWDNSRVIDILNAFLEILDYTNKNNLNKLYDLSLMRLKKEYWGKIKNVDNDDINLVKQKLVELSLKRYCKIYTNLEKAKVSIIIPIFNVSRYLQECLNSITSQTFDYIEIICVNDGSSDNSLDILNDFANRHRNIKIIDKINTGYGNSMNCGLRVANGEYIGIVEPDDFIALDMYKRLYKVAKENNLDVLKSNYYIYKNNVSTLNKVINDNCYNKIFNGVNDKDKLGFVINPTGIFKKVFLDSNYITFNETPGASHQDIGFDYCTTYLADKIMYLDEAFYYYRQDNEEASMFKKSCVYTIFLEQQHVFNIMKKNSKFQYLYNILLLRKYNSYIYFYKNRISLKDRGIFRKLLKDECMQDKIFSVDLIDIKVVEQIKNIVFSKNYIPVIFATNDYYVDYLRVALKSLSNAVNNNDEYHIFIFYSNLKKDSMDKIVNTKIKDNIYIEFIDVFNYIQQYNLYSTNHFSIEMYYRILAPEILKSYEKIIYLDCDILIKGDISEFYNIDLEGNILGAIINPVDKYEKKIQQLNINKNEYINSGVLLIDTKKFIIEKIKNKCFELIDKYRDLEYPDQDLLNMACQGRKKLLEIIWNYQWNYLFFNQNIFLEEKKLVKYAKIIHYNTDLKPWNIKNIEQYDFNIRELYYEWMKIAEKEINFKSNTFDNFNIKDEYLTYLSVLSSSRIDIKNFGINKNNIDIIQKINNHISISTEKSNGYSIFGNNNIIEFIVINSGLLVIDLFCDNENIIYNQIKINGKNLLQKPLNITKNTSYKIKKYVLSKQIIKLEVDYIGSKYFKINIRNVRTYKNNIRLLNHSSNISISTPSWFADNNGIGAILASKNYKDSFQIKTRCNGNLVFKFMGIYRKYNNKMIPLYVNYQSIKINGKEILREPITTWHDKAFTYEMKVKDNEMIDVEVTKAPYPYTKSELKDLIIKLSNGVEPKNINNIIENIIKNRIEYEKSTKLKQPNRIFSITREKYKTRYYFLGLKYVKFNTRREILDLIKEENAKLIKEIEQLKEKLN